MTRAARLRQAAANACYGALRLAGWSAVTALATLGCFVLFFLALGDFSADGFFAQVENLARRFIAADQARRAQFLSLLTIVAGVALASVSACRWRSMAQAIHSFRGADHV